MPLQVRFQGGPRAGQIRTFGDDVTEIVVGRDPDRCLLCFDAGELRVGREHCALVRELGRYAVKVNRDDVVLLDGKPIEVVTHLADGRETELQLGRGGPVLLLLPTLTSGSADHPLSGTEGREEHEGAGTALRRSKRKAESSFRLGLIAVAATVVLGVAAYAWKASLGTRVDQLSGAVVSVERLSTSQRRDLQSAVTQLSKKADLIAARDSQFPEAARRIRESVYVVMQGSAAAGYSPVGTAWVVDRARGLMATNGHVAKLFRKPDSSAQGGSGGLTLRSPGSSPRDFTVESVQIHPGFESFSKLWNKFDPSRPVGPQRREEINSAGPACDVALLKLADRDAVHLAPDLILADDATLEALQPGVAIGLVGYPLEGIALGGVNIAAPTPQTRFGQVTALTDYFGGPSDSRGRQLVHHSVATAGGASGSPIYDAGGKIVAIHNAGNPIGDFDGVRVASPASIQYAQRIDLLRELLADTAVRRQSLRDDQWNVEIARSFQPGRRLDATYFIDEMKATICESLEADGEYDVAETSTQLVTLSPEGSGPQKQADRRHEIKLPGGGPYMLTAFSQDGRELTFNAIDTTDAQRTFYRGEPLHDVAWVQMIPVVVTRPTTLLATVSGELGEESIRLATTGFARKRKSEQDLHKLALKKWRADLDADDEATLEMVLDTRGKLGPRVAIGPQGACAALVDVSELDVGDYVATLVATEDKPVCLIVSTSESPSDDDASNVAPWFWKPFHADKAASLRCSVVGDDPEVSFTLRIHKVNRPLASSSSE